MRTCAGDVAVSEKLSSLLIVVLHRGLLDEFPLFIELFEICRCGLVVLFARCAAVDIERYAELSERVLDDGVVAVDNVLR